MTANIEVKGLAMACLEALQHQLIEKRSLTFQLPECKMIAQVAVKQLRSTENCGFNHTCLTLIHHLLIEKRIVTFTMRETKIIGPIIARVALELLSATEDGDVINACLALIYHLLIEDGSKDYGLAKTCLAIIQHVAEWEVEDKDIFVIEIFVNIGVIEVVIMFLQTQLHCDSLGGDDQVQHTAIAVAWDIIAEAFGYNAANLVSDNARRESQTLLAQGAIVLIQKYLQMFPGKKDLKIPLVKFLSKLASDNHQAGKLITTEWLTTILGFLQATEDEHFKVRYWSALSLCHLAENCSSSYWKVEQPSYSQVQKAVNKAIKEWSLTEDPPEEYTSWSLYIPLKELASGFQIRPACFQLHSAWTVANAIMHDPERYCPLLEIREPWEGTGVEVLRAVIASPRFSDMMRTLARTALQRYEEYKNTE